MQIDGFGLVVGVVGVAGVGYIGYKAWERHSAVSEAMVNLDNLNQRVDKIDKANSAKFSELDVELGKITKGFAAVGERLNNIESALADTRRVDEIEAALASTVPAADRPQLRVSPREVVAAMATRSRKNTATVAEAS